MWSDTGKNYQYGSTFLSSPCSMAGSRWKRERTAPGWTIMWSVVMCEPGVILPVLARFCLGEDCGDELVSRNIVNLFKEGESFLD